MLSLILRSLPILVTAGGIYVAMDDDNVLLNMAKTALVNYEISSMSSAILYRAVGKNDVPDPAHFQDYLRRIMQSSRDPSIDMWGSPYRLKREGEVFKIISLGPDKTLGTEDDIAESITLSVK